MFSLTIVDSDAFTEMPNDAQLLYFRLCLAADDDGFVSNPRKVMRAYGFGEDSMKLLITKKFTLVMKHAETAILLIKHWKMHNSIQKDRYKPSPYHDLLRFVFLDENNAYSLTPGENKRPALPEAREADPALYTEWIQDGYTGKDRSGEVSVGEERENYSSSFNQEEKEKEGDEDHEARVDHFVTLVESFERHGWDTDGPYRLAANSGVTREEIDARRKEKEE